VLHPALQIVDGDVTRWPVDSECGLAAALLGQPDPDQRIVARVQVAPRLRPDLVLAGPPRVEARQRQLEPFGERRLARPVAARDHDQTGAGLQRHRHLGADAAEALHRNRRQVGADGSRGLRGWRGEGVDELCRGGARAQDFGKCIVVVERGQHHQPGLLAELVVPVGSAQHVVP
jgi:hypothetical protein